MSLRGIRGATTVNQNTESDILSETTLLLTALFTENKLDTDEIASIFFSVTPDLTAQFPAVAARRMGLSSTPLFCMTEIPVPGSLPLCIRILIHVNTELTQKEVRHIYLNHAEKLRPELKLDTPQP